MNSKKSLITLASFAILFVVALVTLTGFTTSPETLEPKTEVVAQKQETRRAPTTMRKAQPNEPGRKAATPAKRAKSNDPCALTPSGC